MTAITQWTAEHGVHAVFVLMAIDAVVPFGGELTMLYAGVIAGGAAGAQASLFGHEVPTGFEGFVVLSLAGVAGSLAGGLIAWWIGAVERGRPGSERDGIDRAQVWFDSYGDAAVLIGRLTPVVRSFVSLAAGMLGSPLRRFAAFSLMAAVIWCFALAAAGWALGSAGTRVYLGFGYFEVLAAAGLLAVGMSRVRVLRAP